MAKGWTDREVPMTMSMRQRGRSWFARSKNRFGRPSPKKMMQPVSSTLRADSTTSKYQYAG